MQVFNNYAIKKKKNKQTKELSKLEDSLYDNLIIWK